MRKSEFLTRSDSSTTAAAGDAVFDALPAVVFPPRAEVISVFRVAMRSFRDPTRSLTSLSFRYAEISVALSHFFSVSYKGRNIGRVIDFIFYNGYFVHLFPHLLY